MHLWEDDSMNKVYRWENPGSGNPSTRAVGGGREGDVDRPNATLSRTACREEGEEGGWGKEL